MHLNYLCSGKKIHACDLFFVAVNIVWKRCSIVNFMLNSAGVPSISICSTIWDIWLLFSSFRIYILQLHQILVNSSYLSTAPALLFLADVSAWRYLRQVLENIIFWTCVYLGSPTVCLLVAQLWLKLIDLHLFFYWIFFFCYFQILPLQLWHVCKEE